MATATEARKAIGVHHTATDDGSWDGPGNVARLKADGAAAYYRGAFAWSDPDKDADTKAGYKFPHHMIGADGSVGAASTRAAIAGIAALNGARGGAAIPDEDRDGVYRHLAAHLKDADIDAPELKSAAELGEPAGRWSGVTSRRRRPSYGSSTTAARLSKDTPRYSRNYPSRLDRSSCSGKKSGPGLFERRSKKRTLERSITTILTSSSAGRALKRWSCARTIAG